MNVCRSNNQHLNDSSLAVTWPPQHTEAAFLFIKLLISYSIDNIYTYDIMYRVQFSC